MTSAYSLASVVQPLGRWPAGAVAFLAQALLEATARAHHEGKVGLCFAPASLHLDPNGTLRLDDATASPPHLLAPERARGEPASRAGDYFSMGALLLDVLLGRSIFDAGSPPATGQRLLALRTPPPIFSLCPTIPGALEQLLHGLLQPLPTQRLQSAPAAQSLFESLLAPLTEAFPKAWSILWEDPASICAQLHQVQTEAEFELGRRLVSDSAERDAALLALLRVQILAPGRPEVEQLLGQAAAAGFVRGTEPPSADLRQTLSDLANSPLPSVDLLAKAAALHAEGGDRLPRLGLLKQAQALADVEGEKARATKLGAEIDAAAGPRQPASPWSAGATWVLTTSTRPQVFVASQPAGAEPFVKLDLDAPTRSGLGGLFRNLSQTYASLPLRARLLVLSVCFSAISAVVGPAAMHLSENEAAVHKRQMHHLATQAADCEPGGKQVLVQAYQAVRVGEAAAAERLLQRAEEAVPMGTRCQRFGMMLVAQALSLEKMQ